MTNPFDRFYIEPKSRIGEYQCSKCKHEWKKEVGMLEACHKCGSVHVRILNGKQLFGSKKGRVS